MSRFIWRVSASVLILVAGLSSAGCAGPTPNPTASPSQSATQSASPSASPTDERTIRLDSPTAGATVANPVVAYGFACTFEAVVAYRLYLDCTQVRAGSTLAAEACPTGGAWQIDFGNLDVGSYRLKVMNLSEKDGSVIEEDSVNFEVK